jgi:hypothetical protein
MIPYCSGDESGYEVGCGAVTGPVKIRHGGLCRRVPRFDQGVGLRQDPALRQQDSTRPGLDIKKHYTHAVCFEVTPDSHAWVNVGLGDVAHDVFDLTDVDGGNMAMRAFDFAKVNYEVYMLERLVFPCAVSFFDDCHW